MHLKPLITAPGLRFGESSVLWLARGTAVTLLCASLVAEAGLIRAGGRGANSIISNATLAGTVPFLVPDPDADDNSQLIGVPGSTLGLTGADLDAAAAYGFGPIGFQASVSHDWGRDCALFTECYFELGADEFLDWQGNILGLPEELSGGGSYDALADLRITWEFLAVEEPPPGVFTTSPPATRSLGPDFIYSSLFSANADGSYALGIGSPSVLLGESLGYLPGPDEFSGCFTPLPSGPPLMPLDEAYSRGDCRQLRLDLAQEGGAPTGADLRDQLLANEFLGLVITAELTAPEDYQFANLYGAGDPLGLDAIAPGATGLATPESLRALTSIEYLGCAALPGTACDRFITSSLVLRINVVDEAASEVPLPASFWLMLSGLAGVAWRRSRRTGACKKSLRAAKVP